jgi:hypothetical protein
MEYEYKYIILALDENNASINNLEKALEEGWEPVRETGMPSSGSNYSENAQFPTCLCVLRRKVEMDKNNSKI